MTTQFLQDLLNENPETFLTQHKTQLMKSNALTDKIRQRMINT